MKARSTAHHVCVFTKAASINLNSKGLRTFSHVSAERIKKKHGPPLTKLILGFFMTLVKQQWLSRYSICICKNCPVIPIYSEELDDSSPKVLRPFLSLGRQISVPIHTQNPIMKHYDQKNYYDQNYTYNKVLVYTWKYLPIIPPL